MVDREIDRGQTTIDFALGASILLLGVAFVVVMAPNLFTPFAEGQSADPLTADRLADHLVEDRFADEESVYEFFEDGGGNGDLAEELKASEFRNVNVTMTNQSDGNITKVMNPNTSDENTTATRGPPLPSESGQVTQSQRVVDHDGEPRWLYVRVW